MNLDCVFDSFEFNDELLFIEMDRMEKTPMPIKEKMKKSGLIKREKENVDNYINKGVDAVVLDLELFKNSLSSFMGLFNSALRKEKDEVVFSVIDNLGHVTVVVKAILRSKNEKYIAKVLEKGKFSEDIEVLFLKNGYKEFADKLLERRRLDIISQEAIVENAPIEAVGKLIKRRDIDLRALLNKVLELKSLYLLEVLLDSYIFLSCAHRMYIIQNYDEECIVKLIEKYGKYLEADLEDKFIERNEAKQQIDKIIERGFNNVLVLLLNFKQIGTLVQACVLENKYMERKVLRAILERGYLVSGMADFIYSSGDFELQAIIERNFKDELKFKK